MVEGGLSDNGRIAWTQAVGIGRSPALSGVFAAGEEFGRFEQFPPP
jgi:hypothetical protein